MSLSSLISTIQSNITAWEALKDAIHDRGFLPANDSGGLTTTVIQNGEDAINTIEINALALYEESKRQREVIQNALASLPEAN